MPTIIYIILTLLICLIIGYFFGSFSNGILISKKIFNEDVRNYGSHNAGGTNVGRVYGKKYGLLCIILDCLKTIIAVLLCYFLIKYIPFLHNLISEENLVKYGALEDYGFIVSALGAIIGHCFPIQHGFKGGKAVSSFGGICLASSWSLSIFGFIVFMVILRLRKKVSLASMLASSIIALTSFALIFLPPWMMNFNIANASVPLSKIIYSCSLILFSIILIIRHKDNIVRLMRGEEKTVHIFDKKIK